MHDFRAKLSDPRSASAVEAYLQRARRGKSGSATPDGEAAGDGFHGPVSINLDLTLACDYRCAHCIDAELLNGGKHLAREVVFSTLDVLAGRGLRSVILIGGGEPTLHPAFEDVVAAIKRLELQCAIVTNGAHNDRISAVAPLLARGDWVRLSLDAGTEETFETLHRPRKPVSLEHICRTAFLIRQCAPQIQLGFSFIVMWEGESQRMTPVARNVDEMPLAAALAKSHGFDYISFKPMLARTAGRAEVVNISLAGAADAPGYLDAAAIGQMRQALQASQSLEDANFKVVSSRNLLALLDGTALARSATQPRTCHMQQFRQVVTPKGVYACPAHRGNPSSWIAGVEVYASHEAFGHAAAAAEAQIRRFNAAVECREVTCIYNDANWWLESLVESGEPIESGAAADLFL